MYMFDWWLVLQTECHPGTYGPNCAHKCSGHCLNNSTCNRTTGNCDMGCDSGYTGDPCDKGSTRSILYCRGWNNIFHNYRILDLSTWWNADKLLSHFRSEKMYMTLFSIYKSVGMQMFMRGHCSFLITLFHSVGLSYEYGFHFQNHNLPRFPGWNHV